MTKLDIKDIKLRKKRVDEFRVYHWFDAGTKYLPKCYAHKHYSYMMYDENGKLLSYDNWLPTLKAVKQWIANYDELRSAEINEKVRLEEERKAHHEAQKLYEKEITNSFKSVTNAKYNVGEFVEIIEGQLSKPSTLGEGLNPVRSPARAKVIKVTDITTEEFDLAINDIYNNFNSDWLLDGNTVEDTGGQASDDPRVVNKSFNEVITNPELEAIFKNTCHGLVHVIAAPNRTPFFVNTEGYNYPRYVAKAA